MRPIGAGVFGYIGDRIGRRQELFLSVMLMAIPTCLLGLLPTYDRLGLAAPLLLILLRLVQGLSVGGELTGSVTYIAEVAPQDQRGFATSFADAGTSLGVLLGSGTAALITLLLPEATVASWGWRIPFLVGGALGTIGLYLRQSLPDSPVFQAHQPIKHQPIKHQPPKQLTKQDPANKQDPTNASAPSLSLVTTLQQNWRAMVQATLFSCGFGAMIYIPLVYFPTYLDLFTPVALGQALLLNTVALGVTIATGLAMGWVSDRWFRRKPLLLGATICLMLWSYPAFWFCHQGPIIWVWLAQIGLALPIGMVSGIAPAMLVELFPTEIRLTGYSLSYNLGLGVVGGTAPLMATWLIGKTGNIEMPGIYLAALVLVGAIGLALMGDRSREPLL
jgi:MHS family proline/betaine transporter-like MFS transporter